MILSKQKKMYKDTVSTCSLMLLEGARRLSKFVEFKYSRCHMANRDPGIDREDTATGM